MRYICRRLENVDKMSIECVGGWSEQSRDVPRTWSRCQASVLLLAAAHSNLNLNTASHTVLNKDLNVIYR